jgi:uncharacterized phage protein (TIGR01671 family)
MTNSDLEYEFRDWALGKRDRVNFICSECQKEMSLIKDNKVKLYKIGEEINCLMVPHKAMKRTLCGLVLLYNNDISFFEGDIHELTCPDCSFLAEFCRNIKSDAKIDKPFTGLVDKKGNKVFADDIVSYLDGYRVCDAWDEFMNYGVVFWNKEYARWDVTNKNQIGMDDFIDNAEFEVMGNIHDNPELLDDLLGGENLKDKSSDVVCF